MTIQPRALVRVYVGPCHVSQYADIARAAGFEVKTEGTEHLHIWSPLVDIDALWKDLDTTGRIFETLYPHVDPWKAGRYTEVIRREGY